jgi:two-component system, sensor histidine kinase
MNVHASNVRTSARNAVVLRKVLTRRGWWVTSGEETPSGPPPAVGTSPAQASESGRLRLLIIEDNQDFAEGLQILLELHGYAAEVAFSGTEGLEAAMLAPPDVVLCDIGLPGINGFDVARALRASPTTAGAWLIAVTGYGTEGDRQKAADAGFDAYFVKPVEPVEILKSIARARRV